MPIDIKAQFTNLQTFFNDEITDPNAKSYLNVNGNLSKLLTLLDSLEAMRRVVDDPQNIDNWNDFTLHRDLEVPFKSLLTRIALQLPEDAVVAAAKAAAGIPASATLDPKRFSDVDTFLSTCENSIINYVKMLNEQIKDFEANLENFATAGFDNTSSTYVPIVAAEELDLLQAKVEKAKSELLIIAEQLKLTHWSEEEGLTINKPSFKALHYRGYNRSKEEAPSWFLKNKNPTAWDQYQHDRKEQAMNKAPGYEMVGPYTDKLFEQFNKDTSNFTKFKRWFYNLVKGLYKYFPKTVENLRPESADETITIMKNNAAKGAARRDSTKTNTVAFLFRNIENAKFAEIIAPAPATPASAAVAAGTPPTSSTTAASPAVAIAAGTPSTSSTAASAAVAAGTASPKPNLNEALEVVRNSLDKNDTDAGTVRTSLEGYFASSSAKAVMTVVAPVAAQYSDTLNFPYDLEAILPNLEKIITSTNVTDKNNLKDWLKKYMYPDIREIRLNGTGVYKADAEAFFQRDYDDACKAIDNGKYDKFTKAFTSLVNEDKYQILFDLSSIKKEDVFKNGATKYEFSKSDETKYISSVYFQNLLCALLTSTKAQDTSYTELKEKLKQVDPKTIDPEIAYAIKSMMQRVTSGSEKSSEWRAISEPKPGVPGNDHSKNHPR